MRHNLSINITSYTTPHARTKNVNQITSVKRGEDYSFGQRTTTGETNNLISWSTLMGPSTEEYGWRILKSSEVDTNRSSSDELVNHFTSRRRNLISIHRRTPTDQHPSTDSSDAKSQSTLQRRCNTSARNDQTTLLNQQKPTTDARTMDYRF